MSNCICIIPVRSGSVRIKNKNILKINKNPLISYSINFAKKLKFVDEILVSSDSNYYLSIAKKFGVNNLNKRPKHLSKNNSKTIDVIKYELKRIYDQKKIKYDKVLLLQATTPFREIKKFNYANKILSKKTFDTVITVNKIQNYHPLRMKVFKGKLIKNYINLKKENFISVNKLQKIFIRSGSMYFFKTENLKKYNSIMGKKVKGIKISGKYTINIDEKDDLILAKHYMSKKK